MKKSKDLPLFRLLVSIGGAVTFYIISMHMMDALPSGSTQGATYSIVGMFAAMNCLPALLVSVFGKPRPVLKRYGLALLITAGVVVFWLSTAYSAAVGLLWLEFLFREGVRPISYLLVGATLAGLLLADAIVPLRRQAV